MTRHVRGVGRSPRGLFAGAWALAAIVALGCAGSAPVSVCPDGCRDGGAEALPDGGGSGDGDGEGDVAAAAACLTGWPMPNPPSTGLPHPQNYDTSVPGVVLDTVTGLRWQQSLEAHGYSWSDANTYCAGLTVAGLGGWRLPAVIELGSIVDFTRADPAIDTDAFPVTPGVFFWTSQTDSANSGLAWYVSFRNGGVYNGNDVTDVQMVRCVR